MSYNKTNWQTGDIVTAEKLNKIEDGIENVSGGGGLLVETEYVTDVGEYNDNGFKTIMDADDIYDAYKAGSSVVFHFEGLPESGSYVSEGYISITGYYPDSAGYALYLSASPNWLGNITIEDEKIFFAIYSD